ncbi:hypothetical protein J6590_016970 [Homalodisca vitripennis]|nr:hypothetical protein J6590_016970 [Homalodisca vitripennis]
MEPVTTRLALPLEDCSVKLFRYCIVSSDTDRHQISAVTVLHRTQLKIVQQNVAFRTFFEYHPSQSRRLKLQRSASLGYEGIDENSTRRSNILTLLCVATDDSKTSYTQLILQRRVPRTIGARTPASYFLFKCRGVRSIIVVSVGNSIVELCGMSEYVWVPHEVIEDVWLYEGTASSLLTGSILTSVVPLGLDCCLTVLFSLSETGVRDRHVWVTVTRSDRFHCQSSGRACSVGENRILQALQEDVESDVETGPETDVGSDVDEIEEREDDACRNSDTEQSHEDSENDGPVSDDEIPLADRIQVRHRRDHSRVKRIT